MIHPSLTLGAQYIVDLSFENKGPHVAGLEEAGKPEINLSIQVNGGSMGEGELNGVKQTIISSDILIEIKASLEATIAYILEITYRVEGLMPASTPDEEMRRAVLEGLPTYVFPSVRHEIARITSESGFGPLWLDPIQFDADSGPQMSGAPVASPIESTQIH